MIWDKVEIGLDLLSPVSMISTAIYVIATLKKEAREKAKEEAKNREIESRKKRRENNRRVMEYLISKYSDLISEISSLYLNDKLEGMNYKNLYNALNKIRIVLQYEYKPLITSIRLSDKKKSDEINKNFKIQLQELIYVINELEDKYERMNDNKINQKLSFLKTVKDETSKDYEEILNRISEVFEGILLEVSEL